MTHLDQLVIVDKLVGLVDDLGLQQLLDDILNGDNADGFTRLGSTLDQLQGGQ